MIALWRAGRRAGEIEYVAIPAAAIVVLRGPDPRRTGALGGARARSSTSLYRPLRLWSSAAPTRAALARCASSIACHACATRANATLASAARPASSNACACRCSASARVRSSKALLETAASSATGKASRRLPTPPPRRAASALACPNHCHCILAACGSQYAISSTAPAPRPGRNRLIASRIGCRT